MRKLLLFLASNSGGTSIEYWEKKTFIVLKDWKDAMDEKGAENGG
ncbi:hypothetical protein [Lysinibacillus sphaericus]|nr:hypothetical protein [Lysinibacillus sphaericus]